MTHGDRARKNRRIDDMKTMLLGLDISTSTIGVSVLDIDSKSLVYIGYIKPVGNNLYEKVKSAINDFDLIIENKAIQPITAIYAEQPNIMFRPGFSSAQVLSTILRFNGAFLFTLYQKFGILIIEAMAVSMR